MRFIHPYLFHITYRFHVEKAREAGKFDSELHYAQVLLKERNGLTLSHQKRVYHHSFLLELKTLSDFQVSEEALT
jgi:hypothetical protein